MTYEEIIQEINENLPDNDEQLITAAKNRNTLKDIVDFSEESDSNLYNYILQEWYYNEYTFNKINKLCEFIDLEVTATPTAGHCYDSNGNLVEAANWEAWEIDLSNYYNQVFWYQVYAAKNETAYCLYKDSDGNIVYKHNLKNSSMSTIYTHLHSVFPIPVPGTAKTAYLSNRKASGDITFKTYGDVIRN